MKKTNVEVSYESAGTLLDCIWYSFNALSLLEGIKQGITVSAENWKILKRFYVLPTNLS